MRPYLPSIVLALAASACSGVYGPLRDPDAPASEAAYDLRADGASFGSARVVASPASPGEVDEEPRALLPVTVLVDNAGDDAVSVSARDVSVAFVHTTRGLVDVDTIEAVERRATEAGDGVARVEATFALPAGVAAADVTGFGVRWSFVRGTETFSELTSFIVPRPEGSPVVFHGYPGMYPGDPYAGDPMVGFHGGSLQGTVVFGPSVRHPAHPTVAGPERVPGEPTPDFHRR